MAQAVLFVELVPTTSGIKRNVEKELNGTFDVAEKKGTSVFGKIGNFAKGAALAAAAAAATLTGLALKGGFERMLKIEDAEAKLAGLGHTTEAVEKIMGSALAAVKGTAFGLDTAATVAASAVAAGIKPGIELEKYLRLTADAATIAGISMEEMGSIMNKVNANGRAMTENLNQLQDRGIPILQWLAEDYGVTTEAMSKMVSQGKVDAETFNRVLEENIGGAALKSGETTRGAFANMIAALNRVGVALLEGVFPYIQPALLAVTGFLDDLTDKIKPFMDIVATVLAPIGGVIAEIFGGAASALAPVWASIGKAMMPILAALGSAFGVLWSAIEPLLPQLIDMFTQFSPLLMILDILGPTIVELAGVFAGVLAGAISTLLPFVIQFVGMLGGLISQLLPMLIPLIGTLGQIFGQVFATVLPIVVALLQPLMTIFEALIPVILSIVEALMPLVTVLLEALSPILSIVAEIIGVILVPVIELLAGIITILADIIVWLVDNIVVPYIQGILIPIWTALGAAFTWVYENVIKPMFDNFAKQTKIVVDVATAVFGALGSFFSGLWSGIQAGFRGFINFIIDGINGFIRGLNAMGSFISDITGGAIDIRLGTLPRLANGALVEATPGGSAAILGEGRYDEVVMPLGGPQLDKIRAALQGGSDVSATGDDLLEALLEALAELPEKFARKLEGYSRTDRRGWVV